MKRLHRRIISLFAIAALLFTQLAVSAYACPMLMQSLGDQDEAVSASASTSDELDVPQPGLCQKHCQNEQQNVGDSVAPLSHVALAPAFVVSLPVIQPVLPVSADLSPSLPHATSPPLSIRNCCFRI